MNPKKISRRDAIKLLGAVTGATVLANLPTKWSKPELTAGVIPAHAQTSSTTFSCFNQIEDGGPNPTGGFYTQIDSFQAGISLNLAVFSNTGVTMNIDPSGVYVTGPIGDAGPAPLDLTMTQPSEIIFRWTFVNPSDGTGFCDTIFRWTQ